MALDEALLDSVSADPAAAILRTYEWSEPTLSLGYFQAIADAEGDPRWAGRSVVRRLTGGGALWHDREITYAIIIPGRHPASRPSSALYRAVHGAIAEGLRASGVAATRRGDGPGGESPAPRPFLCFRDRDADDIILGPAKLVGSAQRRRAGAVLQHGSLLLAASPTTPDLPGLADLAPSGANQVDWAKFLREALPRALGLVAAGAEARPEERAAAGRLRREVYSDPAWTGRR